MVTQIAEPSRLILVRLNTHEDLLQIGRAHV